MSDKCPKCGVKQYDDGSLAPITFECETYLWTGGIVIQSWECKYNVAQARLKVIKDGAGKGCLSCQLWKRDAEGFAAEVTTLEAENAELRAKLEKAHVFKFEPGDSVWAVAADIAWVKTTCPFCDDTKRIKGRGKSEMVCPNCGDSPAGKWLNRGFKVEKHEVGCVQVYHDRVYYCMSRAPANFQQSDLFATPELAQAACDERNAK